MELYETSTDVACTPSCLGCTTKMQYVVPGALSLACIDIRSSRASKVPARDAFNARWLVCDPRILEMHGAGIPGTTLRQLAQPLS